MDFSKELIRGDGGLDETKARPGFVRRWFSTDPNIGLESSVGYRSGEHLYGDDEVGRMKIKGWAVVKSADVQDRNGRDDVGKSLDTTLRRGNLVCMEIPEAEYAKYTYIKGLKKEAKKRGLEGGTHNTAGSISGVQTQRGAPITADPREIIKG